MYKSTNAKQFIKVILRLSVFILFFTIFTLKSNAEEIKGEFGTCEWVLDDGILTIGKKQGENEAKFAAGTLNADTSKVKTIKFSCKVKANPDSSYLFYYFSNLETIENINYLDTSSVVKMSFMFRSCSKLKELDLSKFNTSNVEYMDGMFFDCNKLTTLDVSKFKTSKVTTMDRMFALCTTVTSIDVSKFNTNSVTNMFGMFNGCSNLSSLNLKSFNTSSVTDMTAMFAGCSSLETLDVSNFDTSKVTKMDAMFSVCKNLQTLDLSNFDTRKVSSMNGMFSQCDNLTTLDISGFDTFREEDSCTFSGMFGSCQNIKSLSLGEKTFKGIDMSGVYSASLYSSMNSTYYTGFWVDEADPEGSSFAPVNSRSDYLLKKHNENIAKRTYVWQGKPAKITFDKNYETGEEVYEPYDEVINTRYDQIINLSQVKPPQREGYVFKGWAESPDLADAKQKTNLNGKRVNWLDEKILYAIWSKKSSSVTQTVILVNGNSYPDTLTASVLANLKDAPILLSNFENIDTTTLNEIKRIGTTDIVIVGGNKVVSDSVVSQLQKEITGVKVSRICGEDRYQTAIKVGEEVRKLVSVSQSLTNSSNQNSVILAVGTNYPDAISVTSLAEYTNTPILLTGTDTLNEDTLNALKTWNITNVTIIGKEKAISQKVADIIKSLAISEDADNSSGSSITVERIGGEDRYETAKLIGEKLISLLGKEQTSTSTTSSSIISQAILVDGTNFPDALTVSSLLGYYKVPVLLTQQQSLNKITANALKDWSISKVTIVGGVNVVSKKIEDELKQNISSAMTIERLAGADRYETAVKISQKYSEVK